MTTMKVLFGFTTSFVCQFMSDLESLVRRFRIYFLLFTFIKFTHVMDINIDVYFQPNFITFKCSFVLH